MADVPFYFQPTLGGTDINGSVAPGSHQDYRFRAPNAMLVRESLEHSLYGPVRGHRLRGQGTVAFTRGGSARPSLFLSPEFAKNGGSAAARTGRTVPPSKLSRC